MIKTLTLENFQSHKKSELNFDKGLNIIVGQSDSGKTAIIRALRWLVWNKPLGNAFCSNWGGETIVKVKTDSNTIIRSETKQGKLYQLDDIEFKAFGTSVPEEITDSLLLSEINLQSQLDSPFLLSQSSGEVAQHFNKIAKLDKIDLGLSNVQKWINQISFTIGQIAKKDKPATGLIKQIEDTKTELEKFSYLEKFEIDIEVLEELQKTIDKKTHQNWELKKILSNLGKLNEEIEKNNKLTELDSLITAIFEDINEKQILIEKQSKLNKLIKSINQIENKIEENSALLKIENLTTKILLLYESKGKLLKDRDRLNLLCRNYNSTINSLVNAKSTLEVLQNDFEKNFPEICPLCGK